MKHQLGIFVEKRKSLLEFYYTNRSKTLIRLHKWFFVVFYNYSKLWNGLSH